MGDSIEPGTGAGSLPTRRRSQQLAWTAPIVVIALLGCLTFVATDSIRTLIHSVDQLVDQNLDLTDRLSTVSERLQAAHASLYALLIRAGVGRLDGSGKSELDAIGSHIDGIIADLATSQVQLRQFGSEREIAAAIDRLNEYRGAVVWMAGLLRIDFAAAASVFDQFSTIAASVQGRLETARTAVLQDARARARAASARARRDLTMLMLLIVASTGGMVMVTWWFSRYRSRVESNRALLERRVAARTEALQTSNADYLAAKEAAEYHAADVRAKEAELHRTTQELEDRVDELEHTRRHLESQRRDLHKLAAELAKARDNAEAANRAKSDFLAMMSHEIRTPLNGVIGMAGIMAETPMTADQRTMISVIRRSGEALLTIINDILDLSKIEAGRLEIEQNDFDLVALVESSVDMVAPRAVEQGLTLMSDIDPSVTGPYVGDVGRIRQVLLNLLTNAIKFTPAGSVSVEVTANTVADEPAGSADRITFTVTDTGIGIAPEYQPLLFQTFTQLESANRRRFGGTGLGLAICRRLVTMMGGDIGLDSDPGSGSRFWVSLPLQRAETAVAPPRAPALVLPDGTRPRVLLMVTPPALADTLSRLLRRWAVAVETVPTDLASPDKPLPEPTDVRPVDAVILSDPPGLAAVDGATLPGPRGVVLLTDTPAATTPTEPGVPSAKDRRQIRVAKPVRQAPLRAALRTVLDLADTDDMAAVEPETPDTPRPIHRLRVLVAEDNPVNQHVLAMMVRKLGHISDVAANGTEAVDALVNLPYDIVLMDVHMPVMDGYEATRMIRALPSDRGRVPIIAITANAYQTDRDRSLAAGMDDHLAKPIEFGALRTVLERWSRAPTRPAARVLPLPAPSPTLAPTLAPAPDTASVAPTAQASFRMLCEAIGVDNANELRAAFNRTGNRLLAELDAALAQTDGDGLRRAAHSFKGAAAQLNFHTLSSQASAIERFADRPATPDLPTLVAALRTSFTATLAALTPDQPPDTNGPKH